MEQLTRRVLQFRDQRDWKQFHSPKELAVNLCIESAELLQLMQWRQGEELAKHLSERREALADELADVLHSVLLLAHDQQIDLTDAFEKKMLQNEHKYPVHKAKGSAKKYTELAD